MRNCAVWVGTTLVFISGAHANAATCSSSGLAGVVLAAQAPQNPAPAGETVPRIHVEVPLVPSDDEPLSALPTAAEIFEELEVEVKQEAIDLGRRLFHDTRLSGNDTISCATCHDLRFGGVDRSKTAVGIRGQVGALNTPTVFNSGLLIAQFWDGRASTLEEQAAGPPEARAEMGSNFTEIEIKLRNDLLYRKQFAEVFGGEAAAESITRERILKAIAAFEVSLVTPNSRFDKWLNGASDSMTREELRGYALFKTVGCDTCHYGEAVGGKAFQRLGEKNEYYTGRLHGIVDLGRYNVTNDDRDRHVFKVPTLRNVELTAPYFHDGSLATLEEAVETMAYHQLDVTLSAEDVADIVKFLRCLTGEYEGRSLDPSSRKASSPREAR